MPGNAGSHVALEKRTHRAKNGRKTRIARLTQVYTS
ncbi:MAG: hypothetical protein QOF78_1653 [Phycisphaerales bacterium]|jgi:hypothetical protein|nr:hypothetical protein [Phycisphaerales bacterium]